MKFVPTGDQKSAVRAIRVKSYKSLTLACRAVERAGKGYVKKLGQSAPVWSNLV